METFSDDGNVENTLEQKRTSSSKRKHRKDKHKSNQKNLSSSFEVSASSLSNDDDNNKSSSIPLLPKKPRSKPTKRRDPSSLEASSPSPSTKRNQSSTLEEEVLSPIEERCSPSSKQNRHSKSVDQAGRSPASRHRPPLGTDRSPGNLRNKRQPLGSTGLPTPTSQLSNKRPSTGLAVMSTSTPIVNSRRSSSSAKDINSNYDDFRGHDPSQPSDETNVVATMMRVEAIDSHSVRGRNSTASHPVKESVPTFADADDEEANSNQDVTITESPHTGRRGASSTNVYPSVWVRMPNTSFGISMGLAGQAIMWKSAGNASFIRDYIDTETIATIIWILSLLVGVSLFTAYALKMYLYLPLCKDEYRDSSRIHFFNMPHLIVIMLTISVPDGSPNMMVGTYVGQRIIWALAFIVQLCFTQHVYEGWLFSETHNISCAQPQFLLSTVGWMLLAVLGMQVDIEGAWGIPFPTWCLGFGLILYFMVAISIFNGIHHSPKAKGSPALFLLIAPPSVAVVALDLLHPDPDPTRFSFAGEMLLGWCLGIFALLVKIGPKIWQAPPSLGSYWAYVFPLSALGTALIRYAWIVNTTGAEVVAIIFVVIAVLATCIVYVRTMIHTYYVFVGLAEWGDPLLERERLVTVKTNDYSEVIQEYETA